MIKFDPNIHHRHSIRLKGYDYSQAGAYSITIVTWQRENLLGEVIDAETKLSQFGKIAQDAWFDLPNHYRHVELDAFCIMPNHVHGIVLLTDNPVGAGLIPAPTRPAPTTPAPTGRHPLSEIVRGFKSFSARRINAARNMQGFPVWQRNYHEHIIRNQQDYQNISNYIVNNPLNWENDAENINQS
jgi:putative transposase